MSFKSKKSPVLEELEKIAIQKGLVTVSVLDKIASMPKKQNYVVAENFDENIIKLCSGLREKGFYSQASLLEEDYVICKQAETAYKDSLDYKKLHDAAHAKTTKLKNIDGDSEIEDIFEIKRKIMDVVNKQPKSKYATLISKIKKEALKLGESEISEDVKNIINSLNGVANLLETCEDKEKQEVKKYLPEILSYIKAYKDSDSDANRNAQIIVMNSLNDIDKNLKYTWKSVDGFTKEEYNTFLQLKSEIMKSCKDIILKITNSSDSVEIDKYKVLRDRLGKCEKRIKEYEYTVNTDSDFKTVPQWIKAKAELFDPNISKLKVQIQNVKELLNGGSPELIDKKIISIEAVLNEIYRVFIA